MTFQQIFKSLAKAKVKYLIAGGIAVNLHGIERATADLDLIVHLEKKNVLGFVQVMKRLGFQPKAPVPAEDFADANKRREWIKRKQMKVFSFYNPKNPFELIDVFVEHPLPFEEMYHNRESIRAYNLNLPVVAIRDLIAIKRRAGRLQDESDIVALKKILKETKRI